MSIDSNLGKMLAIALIWIAAAIGSFVVKNVKPFEFAFLATAAVLLLFNRQ